MFCIFHCVSVQSTSIFVPSFRGQPYRSSAPKPRWGIPFLPLRKFLATPVHNNVSAHFSVKLRTHYNSRLIPTTACSTSLPAQHLQPSGLFSCRVSSVAGPTVWNSLPDFIRDRTISANCFRRLLKTYLFARY